jgi:hypothetical protein
MWERRKPTPSRHQREAKIPKKFKNFGKDGLSQKEKPKNQYGKFMSYCGYFQKVMPAQFVILSFISVLSFLGFSA